MAIIVNLPSGNSCVQVRRKGEYASNTFVHRTDAETWAREAERTIDRDMAPSAARVVSAQTLAEVIDFHTQDHLDVGKPIRRSKAAVLSSLRLSLEGYRLHDLTRASLVEFGKK